MNNSDSEGEKEGNMMSSKHSELLKLCEQHKPKLLTARDNGAKETGSCNSSGTCSQPLPWGPDPTVHSAGLSLYEPGMFKRVQM